MSAHVGGDGAGQLGALFDGPRLTAMELFDDPRLTAMGLLAETYAGLLAKTAPALTASGLSMSDFDVLIRLARSAGQRLRMTDLATQTALSTSGITRVVDRLDKRGLATRESCPSDRRGSFAVLTVPGRDLLSDVVQEHVRDIDRWFTGLLAGDQLDTLLGTLRVLRDEVRPGATAGVYSPAGHGEE
ncbi:MAG TPA: MarR family transcriptional regulator [Streptosporangiaceae bacterium]|jgi:DNA-binding MarR family transcriptional regulator|nr:MarR family transcriptional regulator [Streptosporangiaceae bacterium]